jgi:hypothetical protein
MVIVVPPAGGSDGEEVESLEHAVARATAAAQPTTAIRRDKKRPIPPLDPGNRSNVKKNLRVISEISRVDT